MEGVKVVKMINKVNIKKLILSVTLASIMLLGFIGCTSKESGEAAKKNDGKINIIATLFPQYDFTRQIVGDRANVTLLLPPGVESHSYDPTSQDIIKINNSNLFIYTGKYMESWAERIISGITNKDVKVLDVSKGITLDKEEENHSEENDHDHDHEEEHGEKDSHTHEFDPHIWTSPVNAKKIVDSILNDVCTADPKNADYYKENANKYKTELDALNNDFKKVVSEGKRKKIVFGGRYALHYFGKEYGLKHESAYDSCSTETEPSAGVISHIIKDMKADKIPVIYYEELTEPKVARSISEETGAEMLLLHSCHNVSKEELKNGATYLSLMKQNVINLKKGLE